MRISKLLALASITTLLLAGTASAGPIVFDLSYLDEDGVGVFKGKVTVSDSDTDKVLVEADVGDGVNPGITQADILGVFFDVLDPDIFSGLSVGGVAGTTIKGWTYGGTTYNSDGMVYTGPAGQSPTGGNVNLNGTGFMIDLVVATNDNGNTGAGGFSQTASFTLMSTGLNAMAFADGSSGLRVQSIQGVADYGAGSAKPTGPGTTPIPTPGSLALLLIGGACLTFSARRSTGRAV